jgi:ribosomal protein L16/L10AE
MRSARPPPPPGPSAFGRGDVGLRAEEDGSIPNTVLEQVCQVLGQHLPSDARLYRRIRPSQTPGAAPELDCRVAAHQLILEVECRDQSATLDLLRQAVPLLPVRVTPVARSDLGGAREKTPRVPKD